MAKLVGFSKAEVLHPDERGTFIDPLHSVRSKKRNNLEEDKIDSPYTAIENLLGATRETKETDVFSLGCLMAQLILNKPLFSGSRRRSRISAAFKILGVPSPTNYEAAKKYPHYEELQKPYKKGVEKAIRFMVKGSDLKISDYASVITLIEELLDLDPQKRMAAPEALKHDCMRNFVKDTKSECFRRRFVQEWTALRDCVLSEGDVGEKSHKESKEKKRKALLMEATAGDNDDDLYNMDDVLASSSD
eukprot:CAMPEP_0183320394 /NCGR_PEP_ID=MMETSP0160_2-20130417/66168_1 /TAXON_ID=2839 ORGANISM="Odontella Sinensis, Strain Grunow 1884" /NCGR_SAMPLE_ID=MMETSP0160_2 /ASSEMBLY_ACC=CAM_ASM_000250 /LENGTH=246 /DNA_ID=CAMNT_0025487081 /DNA_START=35 /DNA_END=772 /DNA_ORIENTATION=+